MDLSSFAVELHTFLRNEAPPVYQDPELFLKGTYLTGPVADILADTILRLNGKPSSSPVNSLATGFGAGKTHTLLLLYHIIQNPAIGITYIRKHNLKIGNVTIPKTKVVAIDCRQLKRNTIWGEIADRLGQYAKFEKYDTDPSPPPT